jgi:hypothetical protein
MTILRGYHRISTAGRIPFFMLIFGVMMGLGLAFLVGNQGGGIPRAGAAQTATTSVTVLNTPPQWTINAAECR